MRSIRLLTLVLPVLTALACGSDAEPSSGMTQSDALLPIDSADPTFQSLRAVLHHTDDNTYTLVLNNPTPKTLCLSLDLRVGDSSVPVSPPGYLHPFRTESLKLPPLKGSLSSTIENRRLTPTLAGQPLSLIPHLADPAQITPAS